jgi:hypothetical protein
LSFFAESIVRLVAKEEEKTKAPDSQELTQDQERAALPCAQRLVQQGISSQLADNSLITVTII